MIKTRRGGGLPHQQLPSAPTFETNPSVVRMDDIQESLKRPDKVTTTGTQSAFNTAKPQPNSAILLPSGGERNATEESSKRTDEDTRDEQFIPGRPKAPNPQPGANDFNTQNKGDLNDAKRTASSDTFNTEMTPAPSEPTPPHAPVVIPKSNAIDLTTEVITVAAAQPENSAFNMDRNSTRPDKEREQRVQAVEKAKASADPTLSGEIAQETEALTEREELLARLEAIDKMEQLRHDVMNMTGVYETIQGYKLTKNAGSLKRTTSLELQAGKAKIQAKLLELDKIPDEVYSDMEFRDKKIAEKIAKIRRETPDAPDLQVYDTYNHSNTAIRKALELFSGKRTKPSKNEPTLRRSTRNRTPREPPGPPSKRGKKDPRRLFATTRGVRRV